MEALEISLLEQGVFGTGLAGLGLTLSLEALLFNICPFILGLYTKIVRLQGSPESIISLLSLTKR